VFGRFHGVREDYSTNERVAHTASVAVSFRDFRLRKKRRVRDSRRNDFIAERGRETTTAILAPVVARRPRVLRKQISGYRSGTANSGSFFDKRVVGRGEVPDKIRPRKYSCPPSAPCARVIYMGVRRCTSIRYYLKNNRSDYGTVGVWNEIRDGAVSNSTYPSTIGRETKIPGKLKSVEPSFFANPPPRHPACRFCQRQQTEYTHAHPPRSGKRLPFVIPKNKLVPKKDRCCVRSTENRSKYSSIRL